MARNTLKEKQRKMRILAQTMTDMEHGTYAWPTDSIQRYPGAQNKTTGKWKTSKLECLRVAGYAPKEFNYKQFYDPYYKEQKRLCEEERAGGRALALNTLRGAACIVDVSDRSWQIISERLGDEKVKWSNTELLRLADVATKLRIEIDAKQAVLQHKVNPDQLIESIAGNSRLPLESRKTAPDRIMQRLQEYQAQRTKQIEDAEVMGDALDGEVVDP